MATTPLKIPRMLNRKTVAIRDMDERWNVNRLAFCAERISQTGAVDGGGVRSATDLP
jgi:hypothetical protein